MYFFTFILKNLLKRPTRTALTVLGLSVAVGSMIALLGISDSFRSSMQDTFEKRGVHLIGIQPGLVIQTDSKIPEAVVDQIRAMKDVASVDAALIGFPNVERATTGTTVTGVLVQGWLPDNFGYDDLRIVQGRKLTAGDSGQRKCMIGLTLAENGRLGQGDKGAVRIGDAVLIGRERFEIVGVFESFNVHENSAIVTPLQDAQEVFPDSGKEKVVTGFSVRVRQTSADIDADVERVRQAILDLKDAKGKPYKVDAQRPKDYLSDAFHLKIAKSMAWVVSLIALLIGVISMLNTMAMSVLERTQEIGILRAVGWPRRRVVFMVLGEAVVLGLAAAAVGAVLAVATTYLLTLSPRASAFIEGGIAPWVIFQGFGVTILIALIGGAFPALRASRLLPTEAIRHD
jgi:putative ABC transport system permease protein